MVRTDREGNAWFIGVFIGVGTKYLEDVALNLLDGKTGAEIFAVRSTKWEYLASAACGAVSLKIPSPALKEVAEAVAEAFIQEMADGMGRGADNETKSFGACLLSMTDQTVINLAGGIASKTGSKLASGVVKNTGTANITRNYMKSDTVTTAAKEARKAQNSFISRVAGTFSEIWTNAIQRKIEQSWRR